MAERKDRKGDSDVAVQKKEKTKTKRPRRYNVFLHNDDYTPMEFVVVLLEDVFRMTPAEATQVMLKVHNEGKGIAGTYSKDIAETKVEHVHMRAEERGYPLRASHEPA